VINRYFTLANMNAQMNGTNTIKETNEPVELLHSLVETAQKIIQSPAQSESLFQQYQQQFFALQTLVASLEASSQPTQRDLDQTQIEQLQSSKKALEAEVAVKNSRIEDLIKYLRLLKITMESLRA
jgi:RecB family exonuclease